MLETWVLTSFVPAFPICPSPSPPHTPLPSTLSAGIRKARGDGAHFPGAPPDWKSGSFL